MLSAEPRVKGGAYTRSRGQKTLSRTQVSTSEDIWNSLQSQNSEKGGGVSKL